MSKVKVTSIRPRTVAFSPALGAPWTTDDLVDEDLVVKAPKSGKVAFQIATWNIENLSIAKLTGDFVDEIFKVFFHVCLVSASLCPCPWPCLECRLSALSRIKYK